jgi:hypothetical protein
MSLPRHIGAKSTGVADRVLIITRRRINLFHALLGRFLPDSNRWRRPRFFF